MTDLNNAYALVIGIASYKNVRQLPYTDDARGVAALLMDKEVCGYQKVVSLEEASATKEAINAQLDVMATVPPGSSVLIYFSGHGGQVVNGGGRANYLLPFETDSGTDADLARTAILSQDFTTKLNAIAEQADRLTIILDCCHAGGIGDTRDLNSPRVAPGLSESYMDSLAAGKGRVILAATRSNEPAYVLQGATHGAFTGVLIEGLRGGAVGRGGVIRVGDLFDFLVEGLEKTTPPQHPVFKAQFEKNYPIALHLGGKTGSGETVRGGLDVLIRLARVDPKIKDLIVSIRDSLVLARARIGKVVKLKRLHDGLHELQVYRYDQIVLEQERFSADANAPENIRLHAQRVVIGAKRLRALAVEVFPGPDDAGWVSEMEEAAAKITRGAEGKDAALLEEGIWGVNAVLRIYPLQINEALLDNVRGMKLRQFFRDLMRVRDELVKLDVAARDVDNVTAGGRDLGRLDRDLDDLMTQHDGWQAVDNRMRQIESLWPGNPRELDYSWKALNAMIQGQVGTVADPDRGEMEAALAELGSRMAQPGRDAKLVPFRRLRNATTEWFYEVDKSLLDRCNELVVIDAALTTVIAAVLEPNP